MKVIATAGRDDVALVYIVELTGGKLVECVESVQQPVPRDTKWVLLVSTMFGCPVGCAMCDAGGFYRGNLTADEMLEQIDFLVTNRFGTRRVPSRQFKIQFARVGEPALNGSVLETLERLPGIYDAPGLMPSVSTVAPAAAQGFFDELIRIKNDKYPGGRFQMQFSLHSTDPDVRDRLIPVKKWSLDEIAGFGERFHRPGDRRIALNFAFAEGVPVDARVMKSFFPPGRFLIKITPLNPTYRAQENHLISRIASGASADSDQVVTELRQSGYEVIVSIGQPEENRIGSNCGQYLHRYLASGEPLNGGYTYSLTSSTRRF